MSDLDASRCPLCRKRLGPTPEFGMDAMPDARRIKCGRCGTYEIVGTVLPMIALETAPLPRLSHRARVASEHGSLWRIGPTTYDQERQRAPHPVSYKQRLLLEHIARYSVRPGASVSLENAWPVTDCDDSVELDWHVHELGKQRLIETGSPIEPSQAKLTGEGWRVIESRSTELIEPDLAFVAMSFARDLDNAWLLGFQVGVALAGYRAERSGSIASTDPIDRKLIGDIRRSRFVVADVTNHRPNVYFEAGYALALSKPVIWTVRKDHEGDLHFDTGQFPHLIWTDPQDLATKLEEFIAGTVGRLAPAQSPE